MRISDRNNYLNATHVTSDLKTRAVAASGVTVFSKLIVYGIQAIGGVILARLVAPEYFGLVAMVTVFSNILVEFGVLRLAEATIQEKTITHDQISTLLWINFALCAMLALFFMALSPLIVRFYREPRLTLIMLAASAGFLCTGLSTQHIALLKRRIEFHKVAAIEIGATVVATATALVLALAGAGYWAIVARQGVVILFVAIGAWIFCPWRPGLPRRGAGVRGMLKFGLNSLGNYAMNYLGRSVDRVLIGWRYGTEPLGQYNQAYNLFVMPINQLTYPLTGVAVTTLSRLRDDPQRFVRYYLNAISAIAFVGMPLSAMLTLMGNDVVLLLLGPQWNEAGQILTAMGPAVGVFLVYGSHGWLHLSLGHADRWFRWGFVGSVVTVISFIVGLPFGARGVAVGYAVSCYVLLLPGLYYAGRPVKLGLRSIVHTIWKPYVAAFVAGAVVWVMRHSIHATAVVFNGFGAVIKIVIVLSLCSGLYLILIICLNRSTKPVLEFFSLLRGMMPKVRPDDHMSAGASRT
jgi:O-antigen/teichoic acid export membrane protein